MKKVYPVIAALMALAVFSCDFAPIAPGGEPVEYTEDGRPLVALSIGRPNIGRALTAELARAGVDFYEVSFKDPAAIPAKYYRASWDYTQTGKIKVPAGDYGGANNAILFAGRYSDMTLLAVARIAQVDGTAATPASAPIDATTTSVTFELAPLLTDVHGGAQGTAGDSTNSSFLITGPAGYITTALYATDPLPHAKFGSQNIPVFKIPNTITPATTASFGLSLGGGAVFAEYNNAIQVPAAGKISIAGVSTLETPPVLLDTAGTQITAPVAGGTLPASIGLTLVPTATAVNGLCKIGIEVPVVALGITEFPHTWYVRGGLYNGGYDLGAMEQSTGGSILLGVGDISDGITIITVPVSVP